MIAMRKIDGRLVAKERKQNMLSRIKILMDRGIEPKGLIIEIGDDEASKIYLRQKEKQAQSLGILVERLWLPSSVSQKDLSDIIQKANEDDGIHGIIVQFPIPKHLDEAVVSQMIDPKKDIDGFHPEVLGRSVKRDDSMLACTPRAVLDLLDYYHISLEGKNVVVIGQSEIVGRPMAIAALNRSATITICHRLTKNIKYYTENADVIIAAAGSPGLVNASMVKDNAVLIDVGITRLANGKISGDITDEAKEKASYATPVPGGVGPMTVSVLMEHIIFSAENSSSLNS